MPLPNALVGDQAVLHDITRTPYSSWLVVLLFQQVTDGLKARAVHCSYRSWGVSTSCHVCCIQVCCFALCIPFHRTHGLRGGLSTWNNVGQELVMINLNGCRRFSGVQPRQMLHPDHYNFSSYRYYCAGWAMSRSPPNGTAGTTAGRVVLLAAALTHSRGMQKRQCGREPVIISHRYLGGEVYSASSSLSVPSCMLQAPGW